MNRKQTFIVICQPPSAARSHYSPYMLQNGVHLTTYPDGDVLNGPGSAGDGPGGGHRSSRRPGGLRRLRHRRPPPETTNAGRDAGPAPPSAEYRSPHRVQGAQRAQPGERAEQPGITWGSGRPGPGRVSPQQVSPGPGAREPPIWTTSPGLGSPPQGHGSGP